MYWDSQTAEQIIVLVVLQCQQFCSVPCGCFWMGSPAHTEEQCPPQSTAPPVWRHPEKQTPTCPNPISSKVRGPLWQVRLGKSKSCPRFFRESQNQASSLIYIVWGKSKLSLRGASPSESSKMVQVKVSWTSRKHLGLMLPSNQQ